MAKGRPLPSGLLVGLVLVAAVPAGAASGGVAAEADAAFVELKQATLTGEDPDRDPVEHLRGEVLAHSRVSTDDAEQALRAAQQASGTDARQRVLEAEAALLELARDNALDAQASDNDTAAREWLNVTLLRVHPDVRNLTRPALEGSLDREALVEALDATIAVRAREAVWEAFLLHAADRTDAARATAAGAEALIGKLVPNATARLQEGPRAGLEENATRVWEAITRPPADQHEHLFPGLAAPLTSLQYSHDVEPLEVFGERVVDGALVALRAHQEDPRLAQELSQAAWDRYRVDRTTVGIAGEGNVTPIDESVKELQNWIHDREQALDAAHQLRAAVGDVALLSHGITIDVESGGVQPNRTHTYDVVLVRPPLEGIGSFDLRLTYDGSVLDVTDVTPRAFDGDVTVEGGGTTGAAAISGTADTPLVESSRFIQLDLGAAGPPGSNTTLHVDQATFLEPDGDRVPTNIVRDGPITIAEIATGNDTVQDATSSSDDTETKSTSAVGVLAAGLMAALAWARRRNPR